MVTKDTAASTPVGKKTRPRGPKPIYIMYRGDAEILEGHRKPEQVLAMIDNDPTIKYQKINIA